MSLNPEVTRFLDEAAHPLRHDIEALRAIILSASNVLIENIKWNGPNYSVSGEDRVTMRIFPPKQIQIIFHRGARMLEQPGEKVIADDEGLLMWKGNDRAIASFKNLNDIEEKKAALSRIIQSWLAATSPAQ